MENFVETIPTIEIPINTERLDDSSYAIATKQDSGLGDRKRKIASQDKNVAKMMCDREVGFYGNFSSGERCKISNTYLPNYKSDMDSYSSFSYCGIFSKDGDLLLTGAQDHVLRLYDASNGSYNKICDIKSRKYGWSIIDVAFSPDRRHFVFSKWGSSLFLCHIPEDFRVEELRIDMLSNRSSCTFSVVYSDDGRELLGGGNDRCVRIYDLEYRKQTVRLSQAFAVGGSSDSLFSRLDCVVPESMLGDAYCFTVIKHAHYKDVNGAVYADFSSNIIYSGSDDGYIKVWDKRISSEHYSVPVGVLIGHTDGITYIDTKGDGRHLISNSKDQSIKLWDTRVFCSPAAARKVHRHLFVTDFRPWDYRSDSAPRKYFTSENKLEDDTSIMTYRGHLVIKTLIRCRFSPLHNTGQRYIYTGCGTGRVVVYDSLTGTIAATLSGHGNVVRDVDWHPIRNEIISSSWDEQVGLWTHVTEENSS